MSIMRRVRCPLCGKTVFWLDRGTVEGKCPHCKKFVRAVIDKNQTVETEIVPPRVSKSA